MSATCYWIYGNAACLEYMGTLHVSNATADTGHKTSCPWLLPCLTMHKQNKTSLPQLNTYTKWCRWFLSVKGGYTYQVRSIRSDFCITDISIYRHYDVYVMQCIISSQKHANLKSCKFIMTIHSPQQQCSAEQGIPPLTQPLYLTDMAAWVIFHSLKFTVSTIS
jgi:hypothetical protein